MSRNKSSFMMLIFALMLSMAFVLLGEDLAEVVNEAELYIKKTYEGERARKIEEKKLDKILDDQQKTDQEKIEEIRREFLKKKHEQEKQEENQQEALKPKKVDEIIEKNDDGLIWTPPLSWKIHSIAIAYDLEKTQTQVISAETIESKKINHIEASENGKKTANAKASSSGASMGGGVSWTNWLKINPRFEMEAHASCKKDWDESKTELWSKSHQEQLASNFEELTKDIQSTRVSGCHLTFAIDFHNNLNENLMFSASFTVPVYMGGTLVLEARPDNVGNIQTYIIPRRKTKTVKFRGEISNTQAYRLLEFMKTNAPTILPDRGQLIIYSKNGEVESAIDEPESEEISVIHCGEFEWKVWRIRKGRYVTLREALEAVNSLYKNGPFAIENDTCTTMFGQFRCGPYPAMAEAEVYPIVERDGRYFSRLEKEQLDGRLSEKGICFHMGSIDSYTISNDYAPKFYELLLKDLLSVEGQNENGKVERHIGWMYANGKGTSKNMTEAVKWYQKGAEQGDVEAQCLLAMAYEDGREGVDKNPSKAVEWYSKAAEKGYDFAQRHLGQCYEEGKGVEKNLYEAVKWYEKAAEQGDILGIWALGRLYENGDGIGKDISKAINWYSKGADLGDTASMVALGNFCRKGIGVDKNPSKAVEWYHKAAEREDTLAQFFLGWCYENGEGVPQDLSEAVKWYERGAKKRDRDYPRDYPKIIFSLGQNYEFGNFTERDLTMAVIYYHKAAIQGHAEAQYNLGVCYYYGKGTGKDMSKAVEWFRKAAAQGNAKAQNMLGVCYAMGEGVEKNMPEAVKWYRKAAEQGNATAQYNLGWYYESGDGGMRDWSKAIEWYRKSASQGNAYAQCSLGVCYEKGEGVKMDMMMAVGLYLKAAEQGYIKAQTNLGRCYEYGKGIERNLSKAFEWYQKAAEQGDEYAKQRLQELNQ